MNKDNGPGLEPEAIARAVDVLRRGGVVAFPTETYYGLAVDPFNQKALERLFAVKQRSFSKAVLTIIDHPDQLSRLVREIPPVFNILIRHLWPGPLTLVFDGLPQLPSLLVADDNTIAIRISSHPLARSLVRAFGAPVTATSANLAGEPAAINGQQVLQSLGSGVDFVIDGGDTPGLIASTIVGTRNGQLNLIREGAISFQQVLDVLSAG
ncbi:MAG: threonylcarbamoyl-AMP synthase [Proteobacteria bacterium]|nr:threonylcarbamoyl-AMP synthase [Pseudomonadota bacterium]MBU1716087.1 threonylcarbamoyl-AMP synthase [Pseudomonadota bacterium]